MVGSNHFTCVWLEVATNPLEQVLWVMGEPAEFDVGERKQERERENRRFARRWQNRADARAGRLLFTMVLRCSLPICRCRCSSIKCMLG